VPRANFRKSVSYWEKSVRVLLNRYWEYFYLISVFDFLIERVFWFSLFFMMVLMTKKVETKKKVWKQVIKKWRKTKNQSPLKNQNQNSDDNTEYLVSDTHRCFTSSTQLFKQRIVWAFHTNNTQPQYTVPKLNFFD